MPVRRCFVVSLLSVLAVLASGCNETVVFTTPGRAPPADGDLVIEVDGVARGFGKPSLATDAKGKRIVVAEIPETGTSAVIHLPETVSTVSCAALPKAVVLTTTSPLEHTGVSYNEATWTATDCSITVASIAEAAKPRAEGSFTATLVRDQDEEGQKTVEGPKTLTVKGTFDATAL